MRALLSLLFVFFCQSIFAQLPYGRYFSVFSDKAAIIQIDSNSISLEGGNARFDQIHKEIALDSASEGRKVEIVKISSTKSGSWKLIGKVKEDSNVAFAILNLLTVDNETLELTFQKDEFESLDSAERKLNDSSVAFGFRFMTASKVKRLMSQKHIRELTAPDLISVHKATMDTVDAMTKRLENQPEAAFFVMLTAPMQVMIDELSARGYNPLVPKNEVDAVIEKLKENPDVKKALEEDEAGTPQEAEPQPTEGN